MLKADMDPKYLVIETDKPGGMICSSNVKNAAGSRKSAESLAEEWAEKERGKTYVVVQCVSMFRVPPVDLERYDFKKG